MNCGKKVFGWVDGKSSAGRFYDCQVWCNTWANLCPSGAISFPSLEELRELYKREGIWAKVRQAMIKAGKING
jgi:hypothetical protein